MLESIIAGSLEFGNSTGIYRIMGEVAGTHPDIAVRREFIRSSTSIDEAVERIIRTGKRRNYVTPEIAAHIRFRVRKMPAQRVAEIHSGGPPQGPDAHGNRE